MTVSSVPLVSTWFLTDDRPINVIGEVDLYIVQVPFLSRLVLDEVRRASWYGLRPGPPSGTHSWTTSRAVSRIAGTREAYMGACGACGACGIVLDRALRRRPSPSAMRVRSEALVSQAVAYLESMADCDTFKVMSVLES